MIVKNALKTLIGWLMPPTLHMGGGGSGGGGSGTTTTVPWNKLKPYVEEAAAGLSRTARDVPEYYPGQTYAPWDPLQQQSQNMMLNYAGSPGMMGTIGNGMNAMNFGLNAAYDPASNPALAGYVDAAVRPLTQAYQEQVLPGIRDQAEMYGGAGSRTGLAEGVAGRSYMDAIASTTAPMYSQAYGQGLDQQTRMMALMPQMMQTGLMPAEIYGNVGAQQQAMTQQGISEAVNRYDFNQRAPYERYADYFSTLQGVPWGSANTDAGGGESGSALSGAVGGGLMGAGAYSALAANPLAWSNPYGWAAIAGGALLGAMSS